MGIYWLIVTYARCDYRISSGWYSGKWIPVDDNCMTVSVCVAWVTGSGQIMSSCVTISQLHQHLAGVSPLLCSICQHGAARPISVQQWPYSQPWRPGFAYSNLHWHCTFAMCQYTICVLCVTVKQACIRSAAPLSAAMTRCSLCVQILNSR